MILSPITFLVDPTNLIHNKIHHEYKRNEYYITVPQEYLTIFLKIEVTVMEVAPTYVKDVGKRDVKLLLRVILVCKALWGTSMYGCVLHSPCDFESSWAIKGVQSYSSFSCLVKLTELLAKHAQGLEDSVACVFTPKFYCLCSFHGCISLKCWIIKASTFSMMIS